MTPVDVVAWVLTSFLILTLLLGSVTLFMLVALMWREFNDLH